MVLSLLPQRTYGDFGNLDTRKGRGDRSTVTEIVFRSFTSTRLVRNGLDHRAHLYPKPSEIAGQILVTLNMIVETTEIALALQVLAHIRIYIETPLGCHWDPRPRLLESSRVCWDLSAISQKVVFKLTNFSIDNLFPISRFCENFAPVHQSIMRTPAIRNR